MSVASKVIGETDDIVVVLEKTAHWQGITLFTHAGSLSLNADDAASLVERLMAALQEIVGE